MNEFDEITLIAEDSSPVGFADALPGGTVAVAVLAARVRRALVAKFTFPAVTTPDQCNNSQH